MLRVGKRTENRFSKGLGGRAGGSSVGHDIKVFLTSPWRGPFLRKKGHWRQNTFDLQDLAVVIPGTT